MKKTLLSIIMTIGILSSNAQVMEPFSPRDSNLFYQWWYEDLLADSISLYFDNMGGMCPTHTYCLNEWPEPYPPLMCGEAAQFMYTDTALQILGIRVVGGMMDDWVFSHYVTYNPIPERLYITLYEIEGDSMVAVARRHIYNDAPRHCQEMPIDVFNNGYYGSAAPRRNDTLCDDPYVHRWVNLPYREYFFDEPVTVNDSFYVAIDLLAENVVPTGVSIQTIFSKVGDSCDYWIDDPFPPHHYKYKLAYQTSGYDTRTVFLDWRDTDMHCYALLFPIVGHGTPFYRCTPVENLHVSQQKDATFFFEWSDSTVSHLGWEFTYVPDGQSPDAGTVVSCDSAEASATVTQGVRYRAFVRPRCVGQRYGDWGDGIPFIYNDGTTEISPVQERVSVRPNPTSSIVEVRSEAEITSVEVFDSRGVRVMETPANGTEARLDLSTLPDGAYLLHIHTAKGTATRQVVKS
ncbi:MAG: T9SS type A sorting domain-containing protein [Bacteroidales bacterium]|nr:T9SS type A sorting domain-containing protein [Bacteroidales bacterium]